ncbi:TauD/TfdA dioxygenase family protein [Alteromonas halophila]|uniref:Taurine dioxygenase n=1 Tax=Alteromonas halophila TaxID=516698 RepID=A0A918JF91_9ALTE|nr:TauD/TfdA family dioxygenase [Alteromonas halophila]GGW77885.1 taurine dioxygenase [Alteromonas halophila]
MPSSQLPPLTDSNVSLIQEAGARIAPLDPVGAEVSGLDLSATRPAPAVIAALEQEMARRGFIVFKQQQDLTPEQFITASCWWGGKQIHSTHGVHPATPNMNRDIFRLSNDPKIGIPGVGPQWHNDGSFIPETFSHSGYHIIRPAERGGGTCFAHQGAAFNALPEPTKQYWRRLASVNSNSGVIHPLVHTHPVTGQECVWLHLGMTGAVLEKQDAEDGFRLLEAEELTELCRQYNALLDDGFEQGYAINYEYQEGDCVFIDNLTMAHRAAPQAHLPVEQQGLRIMHRSTVCGTDLLRPRNDLPVHVDIHGPNPSANGVWHGGGVGFRWQKDIPMQN